MLPSGSWFHLITGFLLGIISTIFIYTTQKLVKQYSPISKIILSLLIYSVSMMFVMYVYHAGLSGGLLTEWQSLGRPAFGDPVIELIDVGYVLAQSGNRYQFLSQSDGVRRWAIVQERQPDGFLGTWPMKDCGTLFFLLRPLKNVVDSKAVCKWTGHSTVKIVYGIDKNGYVYAWEHSSATPYETFASIFRLTETGATSCVFGIITIFLSAAFSSLLMRRKGNPF